MKRVIVLFFMLFFVGCVSATIPHYLQDKSPYKKKFYASYDDTLKAVQTTLPDLGWKITSLSDPVVYEQNSAGNEAVPKQILMFTDVRQTAFFLGTRYAKMNIYVRSLSDGTEVEIRYITVTSTPFKTLKNYKNDNAVQRIFDRIEKALK